MKMRFSLRLIQRNPFSLWSFYHKNIIEARPELQNDNFSCKERSVKHDILQFTKDFVAGGAASTVAKTVIAPVERIKLILQLQNSQPTLVVDKRYKGMVDCFIRVPKEQGFLSFWRGNWVSIVKNSSQESLSIAFKNYFKKFLLTGVDPEKQHIRFLVGNLLAGGGGGLAGLTLIYPLELVRTRLGVDMGKDKKDREFRGIWDCLKKIAKNDSVGGLYKGLVPSMKYIIVYRGFYYGLFDYSIPFASGKDGKLSFWKAFCVAQISTLVAAMISYPLDTVRRRLMMDAGRNAAHRQFAGTISCAKAILVNEGWKAFYHGALANAMRGSGAALVLALYNEMAKHM